MKSYLLLFLLLFMGVSSFSQKRDSITEALKLQIKQADSDSVRIPLEILYSEQVALYDVKEALEITQSILQKIKDKGYNSKHFSVQLATAYNNLAALESASNFSKSLANQLEALKIFEKIQDSMGMGYSYLNLSKMRKSLDSSRIREYIKKATVIFQAMGQKQSFELATSYYNLANFYNSYNKKDSAIYFYEKAKQVNNSSAIQISNNMAIATIYYRDKQFDKAFPIYKETIEIGKKSRNYKTIGTAFMTQAAMNAESKAYNKALAQIDSSIFYAKLVNNKVHLQARYISRHSVNERKGDFKSALQDYKTARLYLDSLNNVAEAKRAKEIELNYEFDKEREIAAIQLENANTKKQLYITLFITALILGLIIIFIVIKNKKQKVALARNEVALEQMEKMKAKLALANRESELKKILVESSITEEVLNKTLDDIKEILTKQDGVQRNKELRSLSKSLLVEKSNQRAVASLQEHINEVSVDFKVYLDKQYPILKSKDKELLYLMKVGLNTTEISKLLKTSVASVKSKRYRIRKKLNLDSDVDIVAHLEKEMVG